MAGRKTVFSSTPKPNATQHNLTYIGSSLSSSTSLVSPPAEDFNLPLDLAYTQYLCAWGTLLLTEDRDKKHREILDRQLAQQTDTLTTYRQKILEQEQAINKAQLQINIAEAAPQLLDDYKNLQKVLSNSNFVANLTLLTDFLENASNVLYLQNGIKCFESQKEYDKFATLIQECNDVVQLFKGSVENISNVNLLGNEIHNFIDLYAEVVKEMKTAKQLIDNYEYRLIKSASDKFASNKN